MRQVFDSLYFRLLVVAYAGHQVVHLLLNAQYYFWTVVEFPTLPATGAWDIQMVRFFDAMGVVDSASGLAGLVFVVGYFQRRPWAPLLGLIATCAYLPSIGMFSYGCWASGTWEGNFAWQLLVHVSFLPTILIFAYLVPLFYRSSRALVDYAEG